MDNGITIAAAILCVKVRVHHAARRRRGCALAARAQQRSIPVIGYLDAAGDVETDTRCRCM